MVDCVLFHSILLNFSFTCCNVLSNSFSLIFNDSDVLAFLRKAISLSDIAHFNLSKLGSVSISLSLLNFASKFAASLPAMNLFSPQGIMVFKFFCREYQTALSLPQEVSKSLIASNASLICVALAGSIVLPVDGSMVCFGNTLLKASALFLKFSATANTPSSSVGYHLTVIPLASKLSNCPTFQGLLFLAHLPCVPIQLSCAILAAIISGSIPVAILA